MVGLELSAHIYRQTLSRELIHDGEQPKRPPVVGSISTKVIRPYMIRALWPPSHAGTIVQPQSSSLGLLLRNLEALLTPNTCDPFIVHTPALIPEQLAYFAISPTPVETRQLHYAGSEPLLIAPAFGFVALRRAGLPHDTAGTSLGHFEALTCTFYSPPPPGRAQKFPEVASERRPSFRMALSSAWSATSFLRRPFSRSSSLNRLAWSVRSPP